MGSSADYSDAIARIQVWQSALSYLEPDGKWSKSPLLQQWGRVRYALTLAQLAALEGQLETEYTQAIDRFLHRKLAGHRKDPTRIQLELPFWRVNDS